MTEPKNQPTFHINQVGNLNTGDVTNQRDQVGIQYNYAQPQSQGEVAQQLEKLLDKLRQKYPTASDAEIFERLLQGFDSMAQNNPQTWQRWKDSFSLVFAGGVETVKVFAPMAGIPIEIGKRLYEIYDRNRKQLPNS